MHYSHLFGPVQSRRLGCSLGIDLVPFKTCTYNCVYCECGATTRLTTRRRIFFPVEEVKSELEDFLAGSPPLDFITFSGSGEPTLSLSIGEVLCFLKDRYPRYRVAVLTNGCLLSDPEVRRELLPADVVLPTLAAVSETAFRTIHRPGPGISVAEILQGLVQFRKEYRGEIWLEVFVVPGVNTSAGELAGLRDVIHEIRADRVQLNTLDRPGTEEWVRPAGQDELDRVREILGYPGAEPVRMGGLPAAATGFTEDPIEQVYGMLKRRPCTIDDIAVATGMHRAEINKILRRMAETLDLRTKREERGVFYYLRE